METSAVHRARVTVQALPGLLNLGENYECVRDRGRRRKKRVRAESACERSLGEEGEARRAVSGWEGAGRSVGLVGALGACCALGSTPLHSHPSTSPLHPLCPADHHPSSIHHLDCSTLHLTTQRPLLVPPPHPTGCLELPIRSLYVHPTSPRPAHAHSRRHEGSPSSPPLHRRPVCTTPLTVSGHFLPCGRSH